MLHVHVWPKVLKKIIKNWRKARIVYIAIQFSWYCNSGPEKNIITQEISFNPLSPSIHIQILQTDLRAFPLRISWENLIKHQGIFSFMIIFYILTTLSLDNVWTLSSKCFYFNFFFFSFFPQISQTGPVLKEQNSGWMSSRHMKMYVLKIIECLSPSDLWWGSGD